MKRYNHRNIEMAYLSTKVPQLDKFCLLEIDQCKCCAAHSSLFRRFERNWHSVAWGMRIEHSASPCDNQKWWTCFSFWLTPGRMSYKLNGISEKESLRVKHLYKSLTKQHSPWASPTRHTVGAKFLCDHFLSSSVYRHKILCNFRLSRACFRHCCSTPFLSPEISFLVIFHPIQIELPLWCD